MNAVFNQVDFIHRLEDEGIARGAAEAIAAGIEDGRHDLATKGDLELVRGDLQALRTEFKGDLQALRTEFKGDLQALRTELKGDLALALSQQANRFGAMLAAGLALAVAILGTLITIN